MVNDPATRYAQDVVNGKIIAGPHVRSACQRHLDDLAEGYHAWIPQRGETFVNWCRECCTVLDTVSGERIPFELEDWQLFIVHNLFSWIVKPGDGKMKRIAGTRRFRRIMLETAKGSGKSTLATAIDMWLLTNDYYRAWKSNKICRVQNPAIMIVASKQEQAKRVALLPAVDMIESVTEADGSNIFTDNAGVEVLGGRNPDRITCARTNGYIEAATKRAGGVGKAGLILTAVHCEELHEFKNLDDVNALEAGFKNSIQPLMMIATNSGRAKTGVAWLKHQQAVLAAEGKGSDTEFAYVCSMDEDDVPKNVMAKKWYPNIKTWRKANPNLNKSLPEFYVRQQVAEARDYDKRLSVLQLQFCVWNDWSEIFIPADDWDRARVAKIREDDLADAELFLGIDLAERHDFTALAMLWRKDGHHYLRVKQYTPLGTLAKRAARIGQPFMEWRAQGLLDGNDGSSFDFGVVANDVRDLNDRYSIVGCAVDPWHRSHLDAAFSDAGIPYHWDDDDDSREGLPMITHKQGWDNGRKREDGMAPLTMHDSIDDFRGLVYGDAEGEPLISIEDNPMLDWNVMNCTIKHNTNGRMKFARIDTTERLGGKIDGLIASVMAIGLACRKDEGMVDVFPWDDPTFTIG